MPKNEYFDFVKQFLFLFFFPLVPFKMSHFIGKLCPEWLCNQSERTNEFVQQLLQQQQSIKQRELREYHARTDLRNDIQSTVDLDSDRSTFIIDKFNFTTVDYWNCFSEHHEKSNKYHVERIRAPNIWSSEWIHRTKHTSYR